MDQPDEVVASSAHAAKDDRPFDAVSVGTCYSQTANDRFGRGASDVIRERDEQEQSDDASLAPLPPNWFTFEPDVTAGAVGDLYARVPTMQHYRNNLTALSHLYNLYFVAYQGQIFVYVPRGIPKQTIPRDPGIKLVPPQSPLGSLVGGYQDPADPHTMNHMIVGMLGREEIVVASYDDGDIIAYYTKDIADCVLDRPQKQNPPAPFFHENVGKSAWGLAVHQESRLIAASSNKCEVTVFAPALAASRKRANEGADRCSKCKASNPCDMIESHVRQRARNWRIVVRLGRMADNIPNIAFVDDKKGFAELICAMDIKGGVWLAHIWKPNQAALRLAPAPSMTSRRSEAWPSPSRVESFEQLLGITASQAIEAPQVALNIERCLECVPDNPCVPIPSQPAGPVPTHPVFPDPIPLPAFMVPGAVPVALAPEPQQAELSSSEESGAEASSEVGEGTANTIGNDGAGNDNDGNNSSGSGNLDEEEDEDEDEDEDEVEYDSADEVNPLPWDLSLGSDDVLYFGTANVAPGSVPGSGGLGTSLMALLGSPDGANMLLPSFHKTMLGHHTSHGSASGVSARRRTKTEWEGEEQSSTLSLDMVYFPHTGEAYAAPADHRGLMQLFARVDPRNENREGAETLRRSFGKRHRLLRLHEKEVELRNVAHWAGQKRPRCELAVFCPETLSTGPISPRTARTMFHATNRLSMVAHLRELSLVVVASPVGRVLLLTPTKLKRPEQWRSGELRHGFRVEWVLPRKSDEKVHRKTMRPLHGMAVGPVPGSGAEGKSGDGSESQMRGPHRRYRLMLHYRNHDILTYEISREEQTGRLCII
ncbi:hypothetical protein PLIIFM63780_001428 [Purpureocillium lilacinum]|nr:hypothetical protein PLIIFM63780_001428 [Purpureocillium lilacinum]